MSGIARFAVKSAIVVAVAAAATLLNAPTPAAPAADAVTTAAVTASTAAHAQEGEAGFNCATNGTHICGPDNPEGVAAGCYDNGALVVPWTRYDDPHADTLYGQLASPCAGQAPTQEQESDRAYAAAQAGTGTVRTVATSGGCSEPAPSAPSGGPVGTPAPAPAPQSGPLVNVNTATVAQLDALPGIGDVLAARIVAQRPYSSVADLHRVARIPAKVFPLVTV